MVHVEDTMMRKQTKSLTWEVYTLESRADTNQTIIQIIVKLEL
jgi:hypothetical protein